MKKELLITEHVPFTAYQTRGFEHGILLANLGEEKATQFIYNSCINYYYRPDETSPTFCYVSEKNIWSPGRDIFFRQTYSLDFENMSNEEILSLIIEWINQESYVYGIFNEKYVPAKSYYSKYDFDHGYLLYGYDTDNQFFLAIGYTANRKFEKYTINFQDYINGIKNICSAKVVQSKHLNLERKYDFIPYEVYCELKDYLNSDFRTNKGKSEKDYYGVSANRAFQRYIIDNRINTRYLDVRFSRFFYENKIFMSKRLKYMNDNKYIDNYFDEYLKLSEKSKIIHMLFIKYNLTQKKEILYSIDNLLMKINNDDEMILNYVANDLQRYLAIKKESNYI